MTLYAHRYDAGTHATSVYNREEFSTANDSKHPYQPQTEAGNSGLNLSTDRINEVGQGYEDVAYPSPIHTRPEDLADHVGHPQHQLQTEEPRAPWVAPMNVPTSRKPHYAVGMTIGGLGSGGTAAYLAGDATNHAIGPQTGAVNEIAKGYFDTKVAGYAGFGAGIGGAVIVGVPLGEAFFRLHRLIANTVNAGSHAKYLASEALHDVHVNVRAYHDSHRSHRLAENNARNNLN